MSRFRIEHPTVENVHAEAGHDAVLSYFVDIMRGQRVIKSYDSFHPLFNRARPLMGCLDFLVSQGFFTASQLEDALIFLQDGSPEPTDMSVANIVLEFKEAAD